MPLNVNISFKQKGQRSNWKRAHAVHIDMWKLYKSLKWMFPYLNWSLTDLLPYDISKIFEKYWKPESRTTGTNTIFVAEIDTGYENWDYETIYYVFESIAKQIFSNSACSSRIEKLTLNLQNSCILSYFPSSTSAVKTKKAWQDKLTVLKWFSKPFTIQSLQGVNQGHTQRLHATLKWWYETSIESASIYNVLPFANNGQSILCHRTVEVCRDFWTVLFSTGILPLHQRH